MNDLIQKTSNTCDMHEEKLGQLSDVFLLKQRYLGQSLLDSFDNELNPKFEARLTPKIELMIQTAIDPLTRTQNFEDFVKSIHI